MKTHKPVPRANVNLKALPVLALAGRAVSRGTATS